jgi:hypothetical protein
MGEGSRASDGVREKDFHSVVSSRQGLSDSLENKRIYESANGRMRMDWFVTLHALHFHSLVSF